MERANFSFRRFLTRFSSTLGASVVACWRFKKLVNPVTEAACPGTTSNSCPHHPVEVAAAPPGQ